jgi:hypothetical protein
LGPTMGPTMVFFIICVFNGTRLCDSPLVDGKFMVSLESFKRIFHCFFCVVEPRAVESPSSPKDAPIPSYATTESYTLRMIMGW